MSLSQSSTDFLRFVESPTHVGLYRMFIFINLCVLFHLLTSPSRSFAGDFDLLGPRCGIHLCEEKKNRMLVRQMARDGAKKIVSVELTLTCNGWPRTHCCNTRLPTRCWRSQGWCSLDECTDWGAVAVDAVAAESSSQNSLANRSSAGVADLTSPLWLWVGSCAEFAAAAVAFGLVAVVPDKRKKNKRITSIASFDERAGESPMSGRGQFKEICVWRQRLMTCIFVGVN